MEEIIQKLKLLLSHICSNICVPIIKQNKKRISIIFFIENTLLHFENSFASFLSEVNISLKYNERKIKSTSFPKELKI